MTNAPLLDNLFLLTAKPVIYAANISEFDMGKSENDIPLVVRVKEYAKSEGSEVLVICAKTEEELSTMPAEESAVFWKSWGLKKADLTGLLKRVMRFWGLSLTSPPAKRKRAPGLSSTARKHLRRQAKFTLISKKALSAPKSSSGRPFWSAAVTTARVKKARFAPRARNT